MEYDIAKVMTDISLRNLSLKLAFIRFLKIEIGFCDFFANSDLQIVLGSYDFHFYAHNLKYSQRKNSYI